VGELAARILHREAPLDLGALLIAAALPGGGLLRQRFAVGDDVVVTWVRHCGQCYYCSQGASVACESNQNLMAGSPIRAANGASIGQGMFCGAFAERIVVHQSQAVAIPKDIAFAEASLLACGVLTGFGAVANTASVRPGQRIAVIGCGGVGLNTIQGATVAGADKIIAIDIVPEKLEIAPHFGATHAFNGASETLLDDVLQATDGRGADYVFVSVGAKVAFDQAVPLLSRMGALVLVGMPEGGVTADYNPGNLASANQRILGSKMGTSRIEVDIPYLVSLYRQGRLKLSELITERFGLDDINAAIASTRQGRALRNVIVF